MPIGRDISSFAVFPTFLTSSPPFPRRHQQQHHHTLQEEHGQIDSSAAATAAAKTRLEYSSSSETKQALRSSHLSYIRCARCGADICHTSQIISKGFTGRHGRAYLVSPTDSTIGRYTHQQQQQQKTMLPNTITQKAVPRQLVTGAHTVADINCVICGSVLGWKYIAAEEETQRYKVGKYIIETRRITTSSCWEFEDDFPLSSPDDNGLRSSFSSESSSAAAESCNDKYSDEYSSKDHDDTSPLEFDSQDEDECEDLFAGVWNPSLAKRRRSQKVNRK